MTFLSTLDTYLGELMDKVATVIAVKVSLTRHHEEITKESLGVFLETERGRGLVARVARSECKGYLQDIAEEAGIPWEGPGTFLLHLQAGVQLHVQSQLAVDNSKKGHLEGIQDRYRGDGLDRDDDFTWKGLD